MLENEEYLELIKQYTDKYRGLYINDHGKWVQLVEVRVVSQGGQTARHSDAIVDFAGNLWWILDELEPAMAAGKVKPLCDLKESDRVFGS